MMAVPWMKVFDIVIGVTDLAWSRRGGRRPDADDDRALAIGGGSPRALGNLEARLASVVVAALKEAFDRDNRRLDLEREQAQAERLRAERALRLELARQAVDREIGRLRLTAGVAVACWLGTLFFSARLIGGGLAVRVAVGCGWALLLAALAASFSGQSTLARLAARVDSDRDLALPASPAGTVAAWLIVVGLAFVAAAVLIA
jgi:hypothetical protein